MFRVVAESIFAEHSSSIDIHAARQNVGFGSILVHSGE